MFRNVRFEILKRYFQALHWTRDQTRKSSLLLRFCFAISGQLIFAVAVTGIIWVIEISGNRFGLFAHWPSPNSSDYISFMGTVAQIAGVFIALYYTALTTVAAGVFVKAPSPVRDLLAGERIGSLYMRYLAFVTFLPLMLIALTLAGLAPFHLAIFFVVISVAVGVLLFVWLGQRAFNLFDPTSLASGAFDQFNKSLAEVIPRGFRWLDSTFQNHARRNATSSLEAISALYDICLDSTHLTGRPLQQLVNQTVWVLTRYQVLKQQIPPKSFWFERTYSYPSWYLMPDFSVDIPQRTGTSAQPETAFDIWWVEKRVEPLLIRYLRLSLQSKTYGSAADFLETIRAYLDQLVSQFQVEHALAFLETVGAEVRDAIVGNKVCLDAEYDLTLAALAEYYGALPIAFLLQFSAATKSLTPDRIRDALQSTNWFSGKSIYLSHLPSFLIPRLEWLRERIQLEQSVEGERITPMWYQQELVNQVVAEQFEKLLPVFSRVQRSTAVVPVDFVPDEHQVWFLAGLLRTQWEFQKKLRYHLDVISKSIEPFKRPAILKDLPWSNIDVHEHAISMEAVEFEVLTGMAKVIALTVGKIRPENLPDYRGQFLHTLAEASLSAFASNNDALLKKIFPVFFVGSMAEFDALKPEHSSDHTVVPRLQIAMSPIFDLIEISGQALVFTELHTNPKLWEIVKSTWDKYLESLPNGMKQLS